MFSQGVWSCYFPDINSKYVHPISSESPLWLCFVCANLAGAGGGQCIRTLEQYTVNTVYSSEEFGILSLIIPMFKSTSYIKTILLDQLRILNNYEKQIFITTLVVTTTATLIV